jgi:hypothetical protein
LIFRVIYESRNKILYLFRIPQEAFTVSFEATWDTTATVVAAPTGSAADNRLEYQKHDKAYLRPLDKRPKVYLDPAISGGSFFTNVEIKINGYGYEAPLMLGQHGWLYAAFNKTFCSDETRRLKYGKKIHRVSNEEDRVADTVLSDSMKGAMETLQFDGYATSKPKMLEFGVDG